MPRAHPPAVLTIHGAWGPRPCEARDAARLVASTFARLANLSPEWRKWNRAYRAIEDRDKGPVELSGNLDRIRAELSGRHDPDGPERDPDLGRSMMAWAGPDGGGLAEWSMFHVSCCKRTFEAGPNVLSIDLPRSESAPSLRNPRLLSAAIASLARIWDPDWITARDLLVPMVDPPWINGPVWGWINYLNPMSGRVASLPDGWRWLDASDSTGIFIFEGGLPDPEDEHHKHYFSLINECATRT